jgi:hypothetical protein
MGEFLQKIFFSEKCPVRPLFLGIKSCFGADEFGRTFALHFCRQKISKNWQKDPKSIKYPKSEQKWKTPKKLEKINPENCENPENIFRSLIYKKINFICTTQIRSLSLIYLGLRHISGQNFFEKIPNVNSKNSARNPVRVRDLLI